MGKTDAQEERKRILYTVLEVKLETTSLKISLAKTLESAVIHFYGFMRRKHSEYTKISIKYRYSPYL